MSKTITRIKKSPGISIDTINSVEEGCEKLSQFLSLDQPVSRDVFISTVEDPTYAGNLIMTRGAPAFFHQVLSHPTRTWKKSGSASDETSIERANLELLSKAAKSLWTWSRSGMVKVDDETYTRRLKACGACPHYIDPPIKLAYQVVSLFSKNNTNHKICNLCGCVTHNKARMATESCPDKHPDHQGYTRWMEPVLSESL